MASSLGTQNGQKLDYEGDFQTDSRLYGGSSCPMFGLSLNICAREMLITPKMSSN